MNTKHKILFSFCLAFLLVDVAFTSDVHVWEMKEIVLKTEKQYENFYADVTCWVELKGPNFSKRIYGFWDGGNRFVVRVVATSPGK